jgi:hypothetical protein
MVASQHLALVRRLHVARSRNVLWTARSLPGSARENVPTHVEMKVLFWKKDQFPHKQRMEVWNVQRILNAKCLAMCSHVLWTAYSQSGMMWVNALQHVEEVPCSRSVTLMNQLHTMERSVMHH